MMTAGLIMAAGSTRLSGNLCLCQSGLPRESTPEESLGSDLKRLV